MRSFDSCRQALLDQTSDHGDTDRTLLAFFPQPATAMTCTMSENCLGTL